MSTTSKNFEILSGRMESYYKNNSAYHPEIAVISGERPSQEEKNLFEKIKELKVSTNKEIKILEIGCGSCDAVSGMLSILDAKEYYGIDASEPAIQSASTKYPQYNLTVGNASQLAFPDNYFDIVVFNYVLEHMVYPEKVLAEAIRVACSNGIIAMIVPVCDLPWLTPSSLRYQRNNLSFLVRYTFTRWFEFLQLRYNSNYYAFKNVDEPIVLINQPNYRFQPDDDLVYIASSFEITKYLINDKCNILYKDGRDIQPCVTSSRPLINLLKRVAFLFLRFSLLKFDNTEYTTTVSIVAQKSR